MLEYTMQACVIAALVIVTEAVTEIITSSKIADPFRAALFRFTYPDEQHERGVQPILEFVYNLVTCGYCCSVWVAAVAALVAPNIIGIPVANWVVLTFLIHRLSNFWHVVYELIRKGRVKTHDVLVKFAEADDGSIGETEGEGGAETISESP